MAQGSKLSAVNKVLFRYRYSYDENGIRYKKEKIAEDSVVSSTRYYLDGSTIIAEDRDGTLIQYYYDSMGVVGMSYGTEFFYFVKDVLGNIKEIRNRFGTLIAEYEYDAWGGCLVIQKDEDSNNIANINPFRYRGYCMDTETGYYYCNYRYYSPELRRFLSPDSIEYLDSASGLNLYVYCMNNPVMYVDPSGHFALTTFGIWAIVGIVSAAVLLGGGAQIASNALAGKTGSDLWRGVTGSALGLV